MGRFAVILPAAGRSSRFGDPRQKKVYADLDGRAVWLRAAEPFLHRDDVGQVIVAIAPEDRELFDRRYGASVAFLKVRVVEGGAERADSIASALAVVAADCDHVAVHDAARPCVTAELIDAVFQAARDHGAALPGVPVADTLKRVDAAQFAVETVPRAGLVAVQTPQAFRRDLLERAYADRGRAAGSITDDAMLVEAIGRHCRVVPGSAANLKITTQDDLRLAALILKARSRSRPDAPAHPFTDEQAARGPLPKLGPRDLFKDE